MLDESTTTPTPSQQRNQRLLEPSHTCWRVERANRLALIVDAAAYFAMVKAAALKARHSVMLIGWDFDTRIKLDPDARDVDVPDKLGQFLNWLVKRRPDLHVYVLKWDLGLIQALGRGLTPLFILNWITRGRVHLRLDSQHPAGATHHQKIIVIDDALAFCGGIDIMVGRWDTREHSDDDPHRVRPRGRPYGPWHDASATVDGEVARALGVLARERWRIGTGETLALPPAGSDPWPDELVPTFKDVDVAIARTIPEYDGQPEIREIEALYLAAIGAAERTIYLESQYFASRRLAEALATRLREPDGPEVIIVNPESAAGWLEEIAMDSARARLLKMIDKADRHRRFRLYCPVTEAGKPIYVHAKIMVIDDRLLRIGSSNLNNRSMGLDTECDLALEAVGGAPDEESICRTITAIRDDLIAEHLGASREVIIEARDAAAGSVLGAIEALRGSGRTLIPFEPPALSATEKTLADSDLLDPERPASLWQNLKRYAASVIPALGRAGRRH